MESLVEENARLRREVAELKAANERLERRVQELLRALEEAQRAGKRQAAPFSRRSPKAHPAKPGRKAGAKYGRRCRRPIPEVIDPAGRRSAGSSPAFLHPWSRRDGRS